jgi:uncharacterized protein DUF4919
MTAVPAAGKSIQNPVQAATSAPQSVQSDDAALSYQDMVKKVESGDTSVDFGAMRMKYAASKDYEPEAGADEINAMYQDLRTKNYQGALDEANKLLKIQYVSLDAHMGASAAYKGLNNDQAARLHHDIAAGLLKSIIASGNGTNTQSAYKVILVREEYAFMRAMGYFPGSQSYIHDGDKSFDEMEMNDTKNDSKVTVYFDVTLSNQHMVKGLRK